MGGRVARGHAHDDDRDERQDERDVVGDDERHAGPRDVLEAMIAAIAPKDGNAVGSSTAMIPASRANAAAMLPPRVVRLSKLGPEWPKKRGTRTWVASSSEARARTIDVLCEQCRMDDGQRCLRQRASVPHRGTSESAVSGEPQFRVGR